jgi:hypothetical protein
MTPPPSNLKLQATIRTRVPTRPRPARRAVRTQISNAPSTKPLLGCLIEAALPHLHLHPHPSASRRSTPAGTSPALHHRESCRAALKAAEFGVQILQLESPIGRAAG